MALLWDAHNMFVVHAERPMETVRQLGRWIRLTHLEDSVPGARPSRRYVLTGTGEVPVRDQVEALVQAGYRGFYSFEWEKRRHPDIEEPEVAIGHYAEVARDYLRQANPVTPPRFDPSYGDTLLASEWGLPIRLALVRGAMSFGCSPVQRTGFGLGLSSALALAGLCSALQAQTILGGTSWTRDGIPATIVRSEAFTQLQPTEAIYLGAGYRHLLADQAAFHGIPALRETLHTAYGVAAAILGGPLLILELRGGVNVADDGEHDLEGRVRFQSRIATGPRRRLTVSVEGGRRRELSVTTAIHERISSVDVAGDLDIEVVDRATASVHASRQKYSDGNTRTTAYGYALLRVVRAPQISVGYVYSHDDAARDNWRFTGITLEPPSGYTYHYLYYPYFTPMQERGHSILGVLRWSLPNGMALGARATIPVASRGLLQENPQQGTTPTPPAGAHYTATGILPTQYHVDLSGQMLPRLLGGVRYEHFRKPYYQYQTVGLNLRLSF